MQATRRKFLGSTATGLTAMLAGAGNAPAAPAASAGLRVCFFTDSHLPWGNTLARLTNDKFHHQERIRVAFDKANALKPDAYVFGGDNVFAVDQANDGGDKEDNARGQFENWAKVVAEKVKVPHHSVIGNHDIWRACPAGGDPKGLAIKYFGMPKRYFSWQMKGWKFVMLDVFGIKGKPVDPEQWQWLKNELACKEPVCIVSHAPIFGPSIQLVGGGVADPKALRELFLTCPNVKLALSGHNHIVDTCAIDGVTYLCGGAVSAGWWEKDYEHFPPAFVILDLKPDGSFVHKTVYWEKP